MRKPNVHCPVRGCDTDQPHTDDILIRMLVSRFGAPDKCLSWVHASLCEIIDSMIDDHRNNRHLGWYSRLRQVEELYFRTLYIVFLATDDEVPHILSGAPPNSFSFVYGRVNEEILMNQGILLDTMPGESFGGFRRLTFSTRGRT